MILVWVLLNFPAGTYPQQIASAEEPVKAQRERFKELEQKIAEPRKEIRRLSRQEKRISANDSSWTEKAWIAVGNLFGQRSNSPEAEIARLQEQRKSLEESIAGEEKELAELKQGLDPVDDKVNALQEEWQRQSILGRLGQAIEPAVRPLGWDWRIGVAALASFPAREVVVSTLGVIYKQGKVDTDEIRQAEGDDVASSDLGKALREARWDHDRDRPVYTVPAVLSLMVFFALCCQCASTLAVIRRETGSWGWPAFTFFYMTALAYVGALLVYQVGTLLA
jgi:ferrous iron transport protein B